jgi:hypothetical protein
MSETKPERTPEEQAAIERGGKRWAIGIGIFIVAVVALCTLGANRKHEPTSEEVSADAKRACQEKFIPDRLKAPSTAEYSNVTVTNSLETYTVTGSVDAENSFGAPIRSNFICIMHSTGDQWVLDSASVN